MPLKDATTPRPGDEDVVAIVGNEPLQRTQIRQLAGFYVASDPTLTPHEAFKTALVEVVAEKAKYIEAQAYKITISLEKARKARDMQRELCQTSVDCRTYIQAVTGGRGITEDRSCSQIVDDRSLDRGAELVAIHKETDHRVMHEHRFGETNCFAC